MRINDESLGMVAYGQNCLQIMTGSRQWYYQFWHKRMISLNSCRSSLQFKRKMATLISRLRQIRWIFTRRSCSPRDHRNRWREQQWENSTLPPDGPDSSVSCYKWWPQWRLVFLVTILSNQNVACSDMLVLCLIRQHVLKICRKVEVCFHSFLTSCITWR